MSAVPWHEIGGGLVFAGVVLTAGRMLWWLGRAMTDYEPHCVYKIPLTDGRWYVGHAKDPDKRLGWHRQTQRRLPDGHPRKWFELVPMHVQLSMHVPEDWVTWYRSKDVAEQMERKAIHEMEDNGYVLANVIKYKGAIDEAA